MLVLDTSVLVHNPNALYSFPDQTVVIPIAVIEELDRFKGLTDKKGVHARKVLRELDGLVQKGALKSGARLRNNGTLKIEVSMPSGSLPYPISSTDHADHRIVAVAWALRHQGQSVVFVSKDFSARIKAESLGIPTQDYQKDTVDYSELYRGWREMSVPPTALERLYRDGAIDTKARLFDNEMVRLQAGGNSALVKYDRPHKQLVRLVTDLDAMGIRALNMEQQFAMALLLNDDIKLVTLVGQAGTGKTLIALACGLQRVVGRNPRYEKLLVARPVVPLGNDIGYLPGSKDQKLNFWMQPIFDNLRFILHKDDKDTKDRGFRTSKAADKIDYLIDSELIEIEAITYIRGRSIPNQYIVIDEAQNLAPHEVKTIVSRVGKGTKIVLTGDPEQIDSPYLDANSNGLTYTAERLKGHPLTGHMMLSKSERSEIASLAADML